MLIFFKYNVWKQFYQTALRNCYGFEIIKMKEKKKEKKKKKKKKLYCVIYDIGEFNGEFMCSGYVKSF